MGRRMDTRGEKSINLVLKVDNSMICRAFWGFQLPLSGAWTFLWPSRCVFRGCMLFFHQSISPLAVSFAYTFVHDLQSNSQRIFMQGVRMNTTNTDDVDMHIPSAREEVWKRT